MKKLNQYIIEKFKISKDINNYNYHPKNRDELNSLVKKLIEERGNEADLNDIDTSNITDMYGIFMNSKFNGNISEWNVSNVESINQLFADCPFNGDISKWDVSSVTHMCHTFYNCPFNGDISSWDVSNVMWMRFTFLKSKFNGDISSWDVSNVKDMSDMFGQCPLKKHPPVWYHE